MAINAVQKMLQALSNPGFSLISQDWIQSVGKHLFFGYGCPPCYSLFIMKAQRTFVMHTASLFERLT